MISRCICLMLQPRFMNSTASQSSSSGCVGVSPILPKLSSVADDAAAEMVAARCD